MSLKNRKINEENVLPLPSMKDRLELLTPSPEILCYYRNKLAEFTNDQNILLCRLEEYKNTLEDQHKLNIDLRLRDDEIFELQNALSLMQVSLLKEKEKVHSLQLTHLEDERKIRALMTSENLFKNETYLLFDNSQSNLIIPKKCSSARLKNKAENNTDNCRQTQVHCQCLYKQQSLEAQLESLKKQLFEEKQLSEEHINALISDSNVRMEESKIWKLKEQEKINELAEKLHQTQALLYENSKSFLELRNKINQSDVMKDKFTASDANLKKTSTDISKTSGQLKTSQLTSSECKNKEANRTKGLEDRLKSVQKMTDVYKEKVSLLTKQLAECSENNATTLGLYKSKNFELRNSNDFLTKRYRELERRRILEGKGLRTELTLLSNRLKEIEKHLYKFTMTYAQEQLLDNHENTSPNSQNSYQQSCSVIMKHLVSELINIKSKINSLEKGLV